MSISGDSAAVAVTVHRLQRAQAAIERELGQLASAADRLRDSWSGEAQRAFDVAHETWQRDTAAMAQTLAQAIGALTTADDAAAEAETAAAALWG